MAGITNGRPDLAVGEPIHFGDIDGFELEHHPISDRLIIRDTENGTVAYVRGDQGGEIGGDGVLIKALKEGKPMADDGRTHDSIQAAERAASSWVFVPPGNYEESVEITTDGLTLRGSGYNTLIDGSTNGNAVSASANNVTVKNVSVQTDVPDGDNALVGVGSNLEVINVAVSQSGNSGITIGSENASIINCTINSCDANGFSSGANGIVVNGCIIDSVGRNGVNSLSGSNYIISNNLITNTELDGVYKGSENNIIIGNRIINTSNGVGIVPGSINNIVANNRVSDSTNTDINDQGTNTILDGNLTDPSN